MKDFFKKFSWWKVLIIVILVLLLILGTWFGLSKKSTKVKEPSSLNDKQKEIVGIKDDKKDISDGEKSSYTDDYKKYEEMDEKEKEKLDVIPRKEDIPFDVIEDMDSGDESIPEKFNLRDVINIKVENQGVFGLCWDFASMKSLETFMSLNKLGDYDFSEIHVDYLTSNLLYGNRNVHGGGNFSEFEKYLALSGVVLESDAQYKDYDKDGYSKFLSLNEVYNVTNTISFPSLTKDNGVSDKSDKQISDFRNLVKKHIMKNGSLYAVIDSSKINSGNLYCGDECFTDHSISIVGWDDNYSKDNFKDKPIHDGAYIALNSWGTGFGDNGYFYISYDDQTVERELSGVLSVSLDDAYKVNDIKGVLGDYIKDNFSSYFINKDGEDYITKTVLNTVTSLDFNDLNLSSSDLSNLGIFSSLVYVNLSNNNITDVSFLKGLKNLASVDLSHNNITDVSGLSNLVGLSYVDLSYNNNVSGYSLLKNLNYLDIGYCGIKSFEDLTGLKDLVSLNLSGNKITNFSLIPTGLSTIYLKDMDIDNLLDITFLKDLYTVDLSGSSVKSLSGIENFKFLYCLVLNKVKLSDVSSLKKLNNDYPIYLNMDEAGLSDISIFNDLNINELSLKNNNFKDISAFKNSHVRSINLSGNKVSDVGSLKDIDVIYLSECNISDLSQFKDFKVTDLDLSKNNISSLKGFSSDTLISLNLSNNNLSDVSFGSMKSLDTLILSHNLLTSVSGLTNLNLDTLDLSNNDIRDVSPLNKMDSLSVLSLTSNKNLKGSLSGNIGYLSLDNCDLKDNLDFSSLNLYFLNLDSNYEYKDLFKFLKNNKSDFLNLKLNGFVFENDDILKFNSYLKDHYYVSDARYVLSITPNDDLIDLSRYDFLSRTILKSIYYSNYKIDNGILDKKGTYIYVEDVNKDVNLEISGNGIITFRV